jgi:H+-translocating NAD(P) transhydrogenase subunit alpha
MNEKLLVELTVFVLSVFVGFEVISKVPSMLHTPLMSATNAIHGIVVVGAMLVAGAAIGGPAGRAIGIAAVILATINVVGGFAVTGRMLQMFKAKPSGAPAGDARR